MTMPTGKKMKEKLDYFISKFEEEFDKTFSYDEEYGFFVDGRADDRVTPKEMKLFVGEYIQDNLEHLI